MPISVIEIMFYVEGKIVVKLVFWLGLSDLIMARQIVGNLPCLELLTDFGCWSYGIDKALKKFKCSIYKIAAVSEFFCYNKLKLISNCIVKILKFYVFSCKWC